MRVTVTHGITKHNNEGQIILMKQHLCTLVLLACKMGQAVWYRTEVRLSIVIVCQQQLYDQFGHADHLIMIISLTLVRFMNDFAEINIIKFVFIASKEMVENRMLEADMLYFGVFV